MSRVLTALFRAFFCFHIWERAKTERIGRKKTIVHHLICIKCHGKRTVYE